MDKKVELIIQLNGFNANKNHHHELFGAVKSFCDDYDIDGSDFLDLDFFQEVINHLIMLNFDVPESAIEKALIMSSSDACDHETKVNECVNMTYNLLTQCLKNNNINSFSKIINVTSTHLEISVQELLVSVISINDKLEFNDNTRLWKSIPNDILGFILSLVGLQNAYVLCSIYEDSLLSKNTSSSKYLEITSDEMLKSLFIDLLCIGEYKISFELLMACKSREVDLESDEASDIVSTIPANDIYSIYLKKTLKEK